MTGLTRRVDPLVARSVTDQYPSVVGRQGGASLESVPGDTYGGSRYGGVPEIPQDGGADNNMAQGEPVEQTVKMILDLPPGKDWEWLPDCNIVVLSSRLDDEGRQRAIDDLQATWRRTLLRAVPDVRECPDVA